MQTSSRIPASPESDARILPTPDPAQVHALLTQSRAAHARKQHASGRTNKQGVVTHQPNYPRAEAHLADALDLRLQAHALDPDHTAPAWQDDAIPHDTLVAFMQAYAEPEAPAIVLSIEDIRARVSAPDPLGSQAFAMLLLESGWIAHADLSKELQESGAFMRFAHRAETP